MAAVNGRTEAARDAVVRFFAEGVGDSGGRDRLVMARALGSLFAAGAIIGLISLVLPHSDSANIAAIGTVCMIAIFVGAGLIFERGRLPGWAFPSACYGATV